MDQKYVVLKFVRNPAMIWDYVSTYGPFDSEKDAITWKFAQKGNLDGLMVDKLKKGE